MLIVTVERHQNVIQGVGRDCLSPRGFLWYRRAQHKVYQPPPSPKINGSWPHRQNLGRPWSSLDYKRPALVRFYSTVLTAEQSSTAQYFFHLTKNEQGKLLLQQIDLTKIQFHFNLKISFFHGRVTHFNSLDRHLLSCFGLIKSNGNVVCFVGYIVGRGYGRWAALPQAVLPGTRCLS